MNKTTISYYDLFDVKQKIENPFSRQTFIGQAKKNLGEGLFIWHDLGNGVASSINSYKLYKDHSILQSSDISGAVLIFNLGEELTHIFSDKKEYKLKKNSFFIGFSSSAFKVKMETKKNFNYSTLTIGIREELFLKLTNNFELLQEKMEEARIKNYSILDGSEIDLDQLEIVNSFKENILDKDLLTQLQIESKITNLIHYTINKVQKIIQSSKILDTKKIDCLERAKQIILKQFNRPLSIKEIAHKSAINECYLKKDFKSYYGMTIHEMLQKHRLDMAKSFLKEHYSVKETSLKVGYKHAGNFSKLFTNHFGISPSNYKKKHQS